MVISYTLLTRVSCFVLWYVVLFTGNHQTEEVTCITWELSGTCACHHLRAGLTIVLLGRKTTDRTVHSVVILL